MTEKNKLIRQLIDDCRERIKQVNDNPNLSGGKKKGIIRENQIFIKQLEKLFEV